MSEIYTYQINFKRVFDHQQQTFFFILQIVEWSKVTGKYDTSNKIWPLTVSWRF